MRNKHLYRLIGITGRNNKPKFHNKYDSHRCVICQSLSIKTYVPLVTSFTSTAAVCCSTSSVTLFSSSGALISGFLGSYPTDFTIPRPLVRPSRNKRRSPGAMYSGRWTKRKATLARSPVRISSRSMSMMAHVCDTAPTCSMA